MALELVGKLIKVLPEVSGQSQKGPWSKQEFVIETLDASYPKKVCLTAWGDKVADLKQFATGDTLKATFSAESREYNERWYTELRAFRIELSEKEMVVLHQLPPVGTSTTGTSGAAEPASSNVVQFGLRRRKQ